MKHEKLKDICDFFGDGDWVEKKDQAKKGIRLVQTGNVKDGYYDDRIDKARYISQDKFKELNCTEIFEGDILISRLPDPVGRACLLPKLNTRMITAVDCTIVRVNKSVDKNYLLYYLQSQKYFFDIKSKITGATRQRISKDNLGEIIVPIPDLGEQKKIVEKLNLAFKEIRKMNENLEKKKNLVQDLKRSIVNSLTYKNE